MEIVIPHEYKIRVSEWVNIPVTSLFVLNGTQKAIGEITINGRKSTLYGYQKELVDVDVVVYTFDEKNILPILENRFGKYGTDFVYKIV